MKTEMASGSAGEAGPPAAPPVRVKLAETPAEWAGAVAVRLAIFVDDQQIPLAAEMDEHDRSAVHAVALLSTTPPVGHGAESVVRPDEDLEHQLLPARQGTALRAVAQAGKYLPLSLSGARSSGKDAVTLAPVVGTGRLLRAAGGEARIGRIAVLPAWRRRGIGSRILRLLEEAALARGVSRVLVHGQVQALPFYLRHGYTATTPARPFLEDGIPHLRLTKGVSHDM